MDVISIGPAVLSISRLFAIIGIAAFLLAGWLVGRRFPALAGWESGALIAAVILGRLVYVGAHLEAFAAEPVTVVYIWQGGFSLVGMLVGAGLWALWRCRKTWRSLLPALATVSIGVAAWGLPTAVHQSLQAEPPSFPDITLTQLDGESAALHSHLGQPVVVNLWASWCGPCRREMPMLAQVSRSRGDITFLFINQGESTSAIRRYLQAEALELETVLLDPERQFSRHFGARGLPTTLFFDAQGGLVDAHMGELSRATVNDYLAGIE